MIFMKIAGCTLYRIHNNPIKDYYYLNDFCENCWLYSIQNT